MTEIPEEIMKAADKLHEEARLKGNKFVTRDAIASSILAERERFNINKAGGDKSMRSLSRQGFSAPKNDFT